MKSVYLQLPIRKMIFNKIIYLCVFLVTIISCSKREISPNIIFILTDDQGYNDLGCYGAKDIETPNIDKLAENGAIFKSYYATHAVCSASRASIMTGFYANRMQMYGAFMPESSFGLNPDEITIAEILKEKDYSTSFYGKWHLGDAPEFFPNNQGFDDFYGILYSNDMWPKHPQQGTNFNFSDIYLYENFEKIEPIYDQSLLTKKFTDKTIEFININKNKPFFVFLSHPQPHVPLYASSDFLGKSKRGLYGDVIQEIDYSVGRIFKELEKLDLEKNTLIIFTSDNGPWLSYGTHSGSAGNLKEGKGTTWEGGQRVPAIVYYPKLIKTKTIIEAPVMGIDWFPTISDILSKKNNFNIDGKSLTKLLSGESNKSPHKNLFFYYNQNELHSIRHHNWKYYFPHKYRSLNGREGKNDGTPIKYDMNKLTYPELYDLSKDIGEQNNLINQFPEIKIKIERIADSVRLVLGDKLNKIKGNQIRQIGETDHFKKIP